MAAKRKPLTGAELVKARQVADRVARAKAGNPSWDPTGVHTLALRDLAESHGLDWEDVIEEWSERAAARQYDAGITPQLAESLAFEDTRERIETQRRLAV